MHAYAHLVPKHTLAKKNTFTALDPKYRTTNLDAVPGSISDIWKYRFVAVPSLAPVAVVVVFSLLFLLLLSFIIAFVVVLLLIIILIIILIIFFLLFYYYFSFSLVVHAFANSVAISD